MGGDVARTTIDASCPACGHQGMEYNAENVDLPYLGESLETMVRCKECGYRHTDFILTETKEPSRYRFEIRLADDMMVRVVRSSSGTIRIPSLGILIEPGIASDAFITNVEGILVRVERILNQLHNDAEDEETRLKVQELMDVFTAMRDGKAQPAELIIEDPFGNSAIVDERAIVERIPDDEASKLKVGMFVHDLSPEEEE